MIRDAKTGQVCGRLSGPEIVYALAFDRTGERLACGDVAGNVVVWDWATSRVVQQFVTRSEVWSIAFLDHPRRLVTHGKNAVLLYDLESGQPERKVDLAGGEIRVLAADRARSRLVVGSRSGMIGSLSLPDFTPGTRLEHAHEGSVTCLALCPDGRLLATGGADRRVVLRDAKSLETLLRYPLWTGNVRDLTFDRTGRRLIIVGSDCDVDLWDLGAASRGPDGGRSGLGPARGRRRPRIGPDTRGRAPPGRGCGHPPPRYHDP